MKRDINKIFKDEIGYNWCYYKYFNRPAGQIEIYRYSNQRKIYQKFVYGKFASVQVLTKFVNNSNIFPITHQEARLWCLK